ncbi:CRISPR-associated endonuclease Cas2 [candidate division KSB1 bacterium]|nr:CRISPR-associated endonuclease Cas2 [candidate division KSB1 bacterium]
MLIIISYDIEDDRIRTRVANKLKDFGPRVQFSVFEADINAEELKRLEKLLDKTQLAKNDSIRVYQICETCKTKIKIWGKGDITQDKEFYIA